VYLPPTQLIFLLTGKKNPFSRFTHVAAGGPQNPTCGVGAQVVELLTTTEVPITLDQSDRHTIPRTQSSPAQSLSTRVTAPRTHTHRLDHRGFRTGQVYKPGPDLHKASQPSEGKDVRSDRIPAPHRTRGGYKNLPLPPHSLHPVIIKSRAPLIP